MDVKTLLLDTCVLLECRNLGKLVRQGHSIFITRTILNEVERFRESHGDTVDLDSWKLLISNLQFHDDFRNEVVLESQHILTHAPDNLHIAAAKVEGATILSYDRLMVSTARDEGVEAYRPEEFLDRMVN